MALMTEEKLSHLILYFLAIKVWVIMPLFLLQNSIAYDKISCGVFAMTALLFGRDGPLFSSGMEQ